MEDRDGFEDGDGCPDTDNDADGIADAQDACPLDPEDPDGELDDDGCPDVTAAVRVDVVIFFERDSDVLSAQAQVQLERVAHTLIAMPDALHAWINGHADDTGQAAHNERLGQRRADRVRQHLIERGVAPERLTAQSYGDTKNVFVGGSEGDRLANRHVDFRVGPRSVASAAAAEGAGQSAASAAPAIEPQGQRAPEEAK